MSTKFLEDVHYVRIPVRHLDSSVKWYTEILGLNLLAVIEEGSMAVLKINEGSFLITLVQTDDDTYNHFTINNKPEFNIGFTSPKIKEFHEHLINHDVKVEDINEDNGHLFFHFYDPTGNKLQVHW